MSDWHKIPNASDRLKWTANKGQLKLNFFLTVIFAGMVLNGYDGILVAGLQALPAWQEDLDYPTGARLGMINAAGAIAGFCVGPFISYVDSTYGRKWGIRFYGYTILLGSVVGCIAGIPGVDGYALFITGRTIIGLGLASFLMTSLIVVQEISHPRSRSIVAQSWDSWYILGSVVSAWVVFGTSYIDSSWSWRLPYILQVPLALFILIAVQFVPETPRFLLAKGRDEEAFQFLVDYHGNGDPQDELVLFEFEEMKTAIRLEIEAKSERWSTILRDAPSRHRLGLAALMVFLTNLSGSSIIYYYYSVVFSSVGITDATTQTGINAGLSIFTWFCQIAAIYAGRRVGRKKILLWVWPFLLLSLAALCATGGVYDISDGENTSSAVATVVLVWVYLGAFNFANPVLYSYPAEIQTYAMRSKGLLVWNTVTQLLTAYVVFVDAIALSSIGYKYYAVYIPLVVIQFGLVWKYMVETKGYTLEEVAQAFGDAHAGMPDVQILPNESSIGDQRAKLGDEEAK